MITYICSVLCTQIRAFHNDIKCGSAFEFLGDVLHVIYVSDNIKQIPSHVLSVGCSSCALLSCSAGCESFAGTSPCS